MRFHYDAFKDAFYIRFDSKPYSESEEVDEGIIFDYSRSGKLIGIEILEASKKLSKSFRSSLTRKKLPVTILAKIPT